MLPRWFGFIWSGLFGMGRSDRRGAVTVKKGIYLASVFLFLILLLWLCTGCAVTLLLRRAARRFGPE